MCTFYTLLHRHNFTVFVVALLLFLSHRTPAFWKNQLLSEVSDETVNCHPLFDLPPERGREILDLVQTPFADELNILS